MNYGFNTQEELYIRVRPALHAKVGELKRLNYSSIKEVDIWNCLIETKWKKSRDLTLADIVSDILHIDNRLLDQYVKNHK